MTTLLEDHGICLPPPLSATTCSICYGEESDHVEVAIVAATGEAVDMNHQVGVGVWNVEDKSLCHSEAL